MVHIAQQALVHMDSHKRQSDVKVIPTSPSLSKRQITLQQNALGRLVLRQIPQIDYTQTPYNSTGQPRIISLTQLKANRVAARHQTESMLEQHKLAGEDYGEYSRTNLLQSNWSKFGLGPCSSASLTSFTDSLMFHTVQEREMQVNDVVVLLHNVRYGNTLTNMDLWNRIHLSYRINKIDNGNVFCTVSTLLHTPSAVPEILAYFPTKAVMLIENKCILLDIPRISSHPLLDDTSSQQPSQSQDLGLHH